MQNEQWGVGNAAGSRAFRTQKLGAPGGRQVEVELIHGEHPHSRRDDRTYARYPDGSVEGYNGHHIRRRVDLEEYNYLKESGLSGDEVRKGGRARIFFNDTQVYGFFFREVEYAMVRAAYLLVELQEHPLTLWEPASLEKIPGRKVWYHGEAAVLGRFDGEEGTVMLYPDGAERFSAPPHARGDDAWAAPEPGPVRDDILSKHIWWWRDG